MNGIKYSIRSMVWTEFHGVSFEKCKAKDKICFGEDGKDVLDVVQNILVVARQHWARIY